MAHASVRLRSAGLLEQLMKTANNGEGYSLRDMADRLPCGKSMVHALLKGHKTTCTQELGERISEVLRVDWTVLFAPAPSVRRGRPSTMRDAA